MVQKIFGQRLREARQQTGLVLDDLAPLLGVRRGQLNKWDTLWVAAAKTDKGRTVFLNELALDVLRRRKEMGLPRQFPFASPQGLARMFNRVAKKLGMEMYSIGDKPTGRPLPELLVGQDLRRRWPLRGGDGFNARPLHGGVHGRPPGERGGLPAVYGGYGVDSAAVNIGGPRILT